MRTPRYLAIAPVLLLATGGGVAVAAPKSGTASGKASSQSTANAAATPSPGNALRMTVEKSKDDLKAHRVRLKLSHEAEKVSIRVTGQSGAVLAEEEQNLQGRPAGMPLVVTCTPSSDEPTVRVDLRATDTRGMYTGVALLNLDIDVNHEEVNFRTDSAEIDAGEVEKLERALRVCTEILTNARANHSECDFRSLTMFIAGHTDTVGSAASNLKLSMARARAIAGWFRGKGVHIPIAYEGFGETALRVGTADQVDEPRNRRTDYRIGSQEPVYKTTGFRPVWKRLN